MGAGLETPTRHGHFPHRAGRRRLDLRRARFDRAIGAQDQPRAQSLPGGGMILHGALQGRDDRRFVETKAEFRGGIAQTVQMFGEQEIARVPGPEQRLDQPEIDYAPVRNRALIRHSSYSSRAFESATMAEPTLQTNSWSGKIVSVRIATLKRMSPSGEITPSDPQ